MVVTYWIAKDKARLNLNWKCASTLCIQSNILHHNTRSTQKSPVRQQNAWFDTKMPGSTQKCPVRHKNALPGMHQLTLACINWHCLGSRANDYVKTLTTLGFWLHHSPCSLGCWTNNTLAARSLSPKQHMEYISPPAHPFPHPPHPCCKYLNDRDILLMRADLTRWKNNQFQVEFVWTIGTNTN